MQVAAGWSAASNREQTGCLHTGIWKGNGLCWGAGTKQRPPLWSHAWIHIAITPIFFSILLPYLWNGSERSSAGDGTYCVFPSEFGRPLQLLLPVSNHLLSKMQSHQLFQQVQHLAGWICSLLIKTKDFGGALHFGLLAFLCASKPEPLLHCQQNYYYYYYLLFTVQLVSHFLCWWILHHLLPKKYNSTHFLKEYSNPNVKIEPHEAN